MAVTETVTLPGQPATGSVLYQPMGGDGRTAPMGRYEIDASLAMDGTGGAWDFLFELDPQYMNLVSVMGIFLNQGADTIGFTMDIKLQENTSIFRVAGDLLQLSSTGASRLWSPPPIVDPVGIDFRLVNSDTFTGAATATIYVFRKGVQHEVPIDKIFQCLTRAGSVT